MKNAYIAWGSFLCIALISALATGYVIGAPTTPAKPTGPVHK